MSLVFLLIMSIFALEVPYYGNYCTIYIRYFSIKIQSAKLSKQVWLYPFSKAKAPKQTIKITTVESLFFEMIILNRLEKFASQVGYFSEMQFGFQEGPGCIEASFTILETINHMLERGSKMFSCFLDVRKEFDTVWIDGLMYKLFSLFPLCQAMFHQHQPMVSMHLSSFAMLVVAQIIVTFYYATGP